jgi:uncharacterized heparinase superfamily protein
VLEDLLDLVNVASVHRDAIPARWNGLVASWPAHAARMQDWLAAMCHPDGGISFFNDAAFGVAPSPGEIARYADELTGTARFRDDPAPAPEAVRVRSLQGSGYVRADAGEAALMLDAAKVGPDYLPGHAHADTLSFELSVFGQRVIVNRGTSRYGMGPERDEERGTPAHSTVTIDGENSSEVWAGFRVARRARPFDFQLERGASSLRVACAHDGYRRLAGRPIHRRAWFLRPRALTVEDRIDGRFRAAVARFHLHPAVGCAIDESGTSGSLYWEGHTVQWKAAGGTPVLESSTYCPEFGRRIATHCLAVPLAGSAASLELSW